MRRIRLGGLIPSTKDGKLKEPMSFPVLTKCFASFSRKSVKRSLCLILICGMISSRNMECVEQDYNEILQNKQFLFRILSSFYSLFHTRPAVLHYWRWRDMVDLNVELS